MRERDGHDAVELEALSDGVGQSPDAEQLPCREPADGDDQLGPKQPEFVYAPEGAELLLARRRRAIAPSRR